MITDNFKIKLNTMLKLNTYYVLITHKTKQWNIIQKLISKLVNVKLGFQKLIHIF